jgi:hypothetical protein
MSWLPRYSVYSKEIDIEISSGINEDWLYLSFYVLILPRYPSSIITASSWSAIPM